MTFLRLESSADLSSFIITYRNVLQIRIIAGQSAGLSDHLREDRMDLAIRPNVLLQSFRIGRVELGIFAVIENIRNDRMIFRKFDQDIRIGL